MGNMKLSITDRLTNLLAHTRMSSSMVINDADDEGLGGEQAGGYSWPYISDYAGG